MMRPLILAVLIASLPLLAPSATGQGSFANWESPHVHPLDLTPDGTRLLVLNTPDNRLEIFDTSGRTPNQLTAVSVGLDPVSVRARNNAEAWVVNHVSDSVSIVDLASGRVLATLDTEDEPCDVVFAGSPERAFVSCSQDNSVLVFDLADLSAPPVRLVLAGEDPRALAVSPDGNSVYVGIFESGNGTTILGGGATIAGNFPPNVVSDNAGPYAGLNPPPNAGVAFDPPQNAANPAPPPVGLIVRKDSSGQWMDDNGGNWTSLVSGAQAAKSGRPVGWDLLDHDIAMIDAASLSVSYVNSLMNIVMGVAVNPIDGRLAVVGTDATNEIRFEPVLNGTFVRVELALVTPAGPTSSRMDLNDHLDYSTPNVPQAMRDRSLGDPRGVAWNSTGTRAWITGMGSNNVVIVDGAGARTGLSPTIEVGEGPTGIALHGSLDRAYVLNRFEGSLSVLDTVAESELLRIALHDTTPAVVTAGRRFLYDTHLTSGLGQVACGSCHVDSRMDQLAWDLGDPTGSMKSTAGQNLSAGLPLLGGSFPDWHPMKGPMTTQTLQDIIGREPLHWRGDKDGLEEFNGAFTGLQGDDVQLTPTEMQAYKDYIASIRVPPNPFRNIDNTLPTNLPLTGHFTTGAFGPAGQPLGPGNAVNGLALFRPPNVFDGGALACVTCHSLPTGMGTDYTLSGFVYQQIPPGSNGERHHALVNVDGASNVSLKIPHLRNMHEKTGFDMQLTDNTRGFGYIHDGSVDSLARFLAEPVFTFQNDQQIADVVAFMLAFPGSDLPQGSVTNLLEPPGTMSQDTHAGVGTQTTLVDAGSPAPGQSPLIATLLGLVDSGDTGLIVKGHQAGLARGYLYLGGGLFQSDRGTETLTAAALQAAAAVGSELTYTAVVTGTGTRLGIDRDEDGFLDRDELDAGTDPADPTSFPGAVLEVHLAAVQTALKVELVKAGRSTGLVSHATLSTKRFHAEAVVRVEDDQGAPVAGALVAASWSGTTGGALAQLTDAAGEALFSSPSSGSPSNCWTLAVTAVTGAGLHHDTGADLETTDFAGTACF
jgi:YVTN family beta-propeller protein